MRAPREVLAVGLSDAKLLESHRVMPVPQTIAGLFEANRRHGPSFDMMRLFAALAVMYSHAFSITGTQRSLWDAIAANQGSAGAIAVGIFFAMSGYLVMESLRRDRQPLTFLRNRALRIYPALICVVLLTIFVLGPAITTVPLRTYFSSSSTALYFVNAIIPVWHKLPGVFESSPLFGVNGSLWTIRYEILCYISLALFCDALIAHRRIVLVAAIICAMLSMTEQFAVIASFASHNRLLLEMYKAVRLIASFYGGVSLCLYARDIPVNRVLIAAACLLLAISLHFGGFLLVFPFVGAYVVIVTGNSSLLAFPNLRRGLLAGDFSYGTYLWAFPTQQTVRYLIGPSCTWWMDLLVSVPIVLVLAMASWHLVEKPFLRLKRHRLNLAQRAA